MADNGATVLKRQSAGDLLGRASHRKAVLHDLSQVRLARQLETTVPSSPPDRQIMRAPGCVTTRPDLRWLAVASEFPADRRMIPPEQFSYLSSRYTAFMKAVYLDPLVKAELPVLSSHRAITLAGGALVP